MPQWIVDGDVHQTRTKPLRARGQVTCVLVPRTQAGAVSLRHYFLMLGLLSAWWQLPRFSWLSNQYPSPAVSAG